MKFQMLLIAFAIILTGCGEMGPPPQVQVDNDLNFKVPAFEIPNQSPSPAPGVAPLIGFGTTVSPTAGINLYAPLPIHIVNPNFREGSEDEQWDREDDDFVIKVRTPVVPSRAFKVRWLVNDKVVEEVTMEATSESWMMGIRIGMRWDGGYSGDHIVKVVIDPDNTITETNENDNTYEASFSIPD